MNMNEFEKQEDAEKGSLSPLSIEDDRDIPGDFTEEELAFVAELRAFYYPEKEELPPYYIQTLLEANEQRFEPVGRGFEHKTSAQVFRHLKLRRHLFYPPASLLSALGSEIREKSVRRSLLALIAIFMLMMLLTVAFTGQSFADGVAILLRGTHGSGVALTGQYPANVQHPPHSQQKKPASTRQIISFRQAQNQMDFRVYWPHYMPTLYSLANINLYVGVDEQWADGPMLEFEYSLPHSTVTPQGTGEIWVREFKPKADVLQLVEDGAFSPIDMDNSGKATAIYIDGEWSGKNPPTWVTGNRSELIYQQGGVVFWIAGDQRDNIGEEELMQVAQGLASSTPSHHFRLEETPLLVTQMSEDSTQGPFSNDVIQVFPYDGTGGGPYYITVSSCQPPKSAR